MYFDYILYLFAIDCHCVCVHVHRSVSLSIYNYVNVHTTDSVTCLSPLNISDTILSRSRFTFCCRLISPTLLQT